MCGFDVFDVICLFVMKVYVQGCQYVVVGCWLILIGYVGYLEVEGMIGQILVEVIFVQSEVEVDMLMLFVDMLVVYIMQIMLLVDDMCGIIEVLQCWFIDFVGLDMCDICYVMQNCQVVVCELSEQVDVLFVVGVMNSLNLNCLCEIGIESGVLSYFVVDGLEVKVEWFVGVQMVGLIVGVLVFEEMVEDVISVLCVLGFVDVVMMVGCEEKVEFKLLVKFM